MKGHSIRKLKSTVLGAFLIFHRVWEEMPYRQRIGKINIKRRLN